MKNRRKARELTLQILYQADVRGISPTEALRIILSRYRFKPEVECFSKKLIQGTEKFLPWIDVLIKRYAQNWTLDRMAVVDRNILRFSIYELLFLEEVPPIVSINEAVEIAKRYGTSDSGKFINGILDRIRRERSPDSPLQWSNLLQKLQDSILTSLIKLKKEAKIYLVGGFIRDTLLGREGRDFDLILDRPNFCLVEKFAREYEKSPVVLNENLRRVIIAERYQLDFSLKKSPNIESDLKKRDFTIDALALDLDFTSYPHLYLIDLKGGLDDLLEGRIRPMSETVLDDDPLRMLKAFRLKVQLEFEIDSKLIQMILKKYKLVDRVARERINEEFFRLLSLPYSGKHLTHPAARKLLEKMLKTPCYPENLHYLESILNNTHSPISSIKSECIKYLKRKVGGKTRLQLLKLISLILSFPPDKKVIEKSALALKLSNKETKILQKVANLLPLLDNLKEKSFDSPQMSEFFSRTGEEMVEICLAAIVIRPEQSDLNFYVKMLSTFFEKLTLILHPPKLISGNELIELLGLKPGPHISAILRKIHQAQIAGKVQEKKEAIKLAQKIIKEK